jgi:hypothetical protein
MKLVLLNLRCILLRDVNIIVLCLVLGQNADCEALFPLKLSTNHRYLVDQKDVPFLIKEISAWGLVQALSETDASGFMDSIKVKGFNTLLVSAISYDTRFAGNPPDWTGNCPFNVKWDFSTPNISYFEHVDRILKMAENKGFLVLFVPCYLGYSGDPNQGWFTRLLDSQNDTLKSHTYGQFMGKRYKNFKNIIWVAGGDNDAAGNLRSHMLNIIAGIKKEDSKHLWTAHWSSPTNWSSANHPFASFVDLDGLYCFTESDLGATGPQYKAELDKYRGGKLFFQLDQSYEQDIPGGQDNINYQWIRRKNYDGLLSGCAGTSFSPGINKDQQLYKFYNWRDFMNTRGMIETMFCFRLFESRPWWKLIPDQNSALTITSGRGIYGEIDWVCLARTDNGSTIIAYVPSTRKITINMAQLSGSSANAWWYNPQNGKATLIGSIPTKGEQEFTSSDEDQILVIDDSSLNLKAPGSIVPR